MEDAAVAARAIDNDYFDAYEDLDVHELMLRDRARTECYRAVLEVNRAYLKDRVVVDVGCGTGILSLFALEAGARRVYALERSALADVARQAARVNGYGEERMVVLRGDAASMEAPEKVDILISEWQGFYLLHEGMLDAVIEARDRWLRPEGLILPTHAALFVQPVRLPRPMQRRVEFWRSVYGFDFSHVAGTVLRQLRSRRAPHIVALEADEVVGPGPQLVFDLDCRRVTVPELAEFRRQVRLAVPRDTPCAGLGFWFDLSFDVVTHSPSSPAGRIVLSTGPAADPTHWKQAVVLLPDTPTFSTDHELVCDIVLSKSPDNPRCYDISVLIRE
mmetsp:Transcript_30914/g.86612  ORF Transcript_30914/g.86612 Transcript_30914/m.86612 type:complete len:333 (+) Transcript_30914:166-1164(+)|eukprot:CAMPEP_0119120116 /NCGR_PEP_ID=MMETSP1310-20130426/1303_1 /TAXON_ID=464262 /ORGANISM="Genus nov. species nov., Strain RCC2339" /LENGTH=332 /DNA_ID=CAMNT_0007109581 /DNA_START=152 /DNA_END=1150 /DNA_ORIENTATION=-